MKIPFKWECLDIEPLENGAIFTSRAKVIKGWMIKNEILLDKDRGDGYMSASSSLSFLEDPHHQWTIE